MLCAIKMFHRILCPFFCQLAVMVSTKNGTNYIYGLNDFICTVRITILGKNSSMCTPLGQQECPLYPTELAFALDVSQDNGRANFNNMRDTVLRLVRDITIAESNCPRGARVALTLYNNEVTTVVRFADAMKKRALVQQIEGLQTLQNQKKRSLETAMSFVAQNTFKRVRSGFLMRKVAIFFVGGPVTDQRKALTTAALRLHDAGIATLFLVSREDRTLSTALQVKHNKNKTHLKGELCSR